MVLNVPLVNLTQSLYQPSPTSYAPAEMLVKSGPSAGIATTVPVAILNTTIRPSFTKLLIPKPNVEYSAALA